MGFGLFPQEVSVESQTHTTSPSPPLSNHLPASFAGGSFVSFDTTDPQGCVITSDRLGSFHSSQSLSRQFEDSLGIGRDISRLHAASATMEARMRRMVLATKRSGKTDNPATKVWKRRGIENRPIFV
jgi:hypothetical protein